MKCLNCKKELIRYRKSALIPGSESKGKTKHYIICSEFCCGNVMIATVDEAGIIVNLENTPNDNNPNTLAMMQQASELFQLHRDSFRARNTNEQYARKELETPKTASEFESKQDTATIVNPTASETKQTVSDKTTATECACHTCKVSNCDKKSGFFKKLWHKILHLFGRR